MSRAVRRQQSSTPKEGAGNRSLGMRQQRSQNRGSKPPASGRRGFRPKVPRFFEEIWAELKKVTWPTREETAYLTMVVIVVALVVGMMLGIVDIFFNWLIDKLLLE